MKTELTYKQTIDLISLGVPKEKASGTIKVFDEDDTLFCTCPNFKLDDFLNGEILPKEIKKGYSIYLLQITMDKARCMVKYKEGDYSWLCSFIEEELIDALYELACWYYGEYLKMKRNEKEIL